VVRPQRRVELRLARILERWVMRNAAAVTSTTAAVASLLTARDSVLADRIHVIRNGYDGVIAPPLAHTDGRLSILFAGVLYVRRTPYPLLAALEELLSRPDVDPARIRVTFMGAKTGKFSDRSLETWVRGKRCAAVIRILPEQTAARVAQEVAEATVLLNLAQQQHLHVPAKTYEHLAAGREVLLICEDSCETAQLVSGIRGVIQVDQSNPQLLAEVLRDLYNRHVADGTLVVPAEEDVRRFSRALANERFYAVLGPLAARRDPSERPPLGRQFLSDARLYQRLSRSHSAGILSLASTMLCNRGLWLLTFHRIAHYCVLHRDVRNPAWWFARVLKSIGAAFSVLFCKSAFSGDCEIRGSAYLSNRGYLICGAHSIGEGSVIHDRCTLGYTVARGREGRPVIGRNVWIGPNCIIGGAITVGDGATVLPGSLLTYSVPPGAVVKGNPASIVRRDFDNSELRSSLALVQDIATTSP
jgi:serine acetyltransferase